jgi:hypothetical protein
MRNNLTNVHTYVQSLILLSPFVVSETICPRVSQSLPRLEHQSLTAQVVLVTTNTNLMIDLSHRIGI